MDYGILFPSTDEVRECRLVGYTYSDWFGDVDDRKSRVGYVVMLGGALIACSSRNEHMVALSSYKAKYIAASLCAS